MGSEAAFDVTLVYSPAPRTVHELVLNVNPPCSVLLALQRSGWLTRFPEIDDRRTLLGVWGRKVPLGHLLRAQDRVEVYRPLRVDPKVARRERFVGQGARAAGLFAKRRDNAKAGY